MTAIVVLAVGVSLAACGSGPSSSGIASHSTTTTTTMNSSGNGSTQGSGLLAYSSCMRAHGVANFPDPSSSGGIPKETAQQLGVSQSQLDTAQSTCQQRIPAGEALNGQSVETVTPQEQQDYLNVTACLHSHGFPNFPEPIFQNGQVEFPMVQHLVDINSPQFMQAYKVCQKDIPSGLPFSGGGSGG